jgi:AmmeMemoRadiSam system protein B/AmmeMemoRadiSam system protein A
MSGSLMSLALLVSAPGPCTKKIRHPAVAGKFYPANAEELSQLISNMLSKAATTVKGEIVAAVAPHAGYKYSGPAAAYTYSALKGRKYRRIVVIAPTHYEAFHFTSVYDGDFYETPLGSVPVDKEFAQRLAEQHATIQLSEKGHASTGAGGEHAIEVQLPWLQKIIGDFELVPIVMGSQNYESSRVLGIALAKLIRTEGDAERTLVLASSDLSHYHSCDEARKLDSKTLQALKNWDYLSMTRNFEGRIWEACGGAPMVAAMMYAERMGANRAEVLHYQNSGDRSGDSSRVVGYSANVFVKSAVPEKGNEEFQLSAQEKAKLLALARNAVQAVATKHELYEPPAPAEAALNQEAGLFVTIKRRGRLRGCVGYTSAVEPLYLAVRDTATLAAARDARFVPVSAEELSELAYEVSVLSPMRRVTNVEQIEVGRDGLLVKNADREGLLLPQVPLEHRWDRTRFLEEACIKAGMDREQWRDEGTDIFRFSARVFRDKETALRGLAVG